MNLIPFCVVEPELALREMRVMYLLVEREGLPVGSYGLFEFYCPDPECDCRRVVLTVAEKDQPSRFLASINYAFDPDDEMPGPFLDPLNPQSNCAQQLLEMVERAVLIDQGYLDRLERHYAMVKQAASDPNHPAYDELQQLMDKDPEDIFHQRFPSQDDSVGRNDPCPCGSGRKYKHCCMGKDR